jgi:hypothetical protein
VKRPDIREGKNNPENETDDEREFLFRKTETADQ